RPRPVGWYSGLSSVADCAESRWLPQAIPGRRSERVRTRKSRPISVSISPSSRVWLGRRAPNFAVDRTAGSHSLAAAGHRGVAPGEHIVLPLSRLLVLFGE